MGQGEVHCTCRMGGGVEWGVDRWRWIGEEDRGGGTEGGGTGEKWDGGEVVQEERGG